MSYQLGAAEPFGEGIKRIAVEQVDIALRALADPRGGGGVDRAVHDARKCFKRARSALRLSRQTLGNRRYRRENARLRVLGLALATPRESAVAVLSVEWLRKEFAPMLRQDVFVELRAHFVERHTAALWQTVEREQAFIHVSRRLLAARRKLQNLGVRDRSDLAWTSALRSSYASGRAQMEQAYLDGSPEAFHEWRKQAKHLRYQLAILKGAWTGRLDRAFDLLHELSDLLGVHHDLVELRGQLRRDSVGTTVRRRNEAKGLRALIEGQRVQLEREARGVGQRIYSREAKAVIKRVVSCWEDWRAI